MNSFDTSISLFLNQFAQRSPRFDEFVTFLSDCNLLKGGIIVSGDQSIEAAPIKPAITHDYLDKVDIRVGTIESVEDVPKSNKLECAGPMMRELNE